MTVQIYPPSRAVDQHRVRPALASQPPLYAGDRLSRVEFERRYQADVITWLGMYRSVTPGVMVGDNATLRLDYENVVQPDALLRLDPALGGRSRITADDYLAGPPELVVAIAASSAACDLGVKRRVYARNGVQEYLAAQAYEQRIDWFVLREGVASPEHAAFVAGLQQQMR